MGMRMAIPRSVHRSRTPDRSAAQAPCVVPVYWDAHFQQCAADVAAFDEFLRALFASSWMSGLGEYGIQPAQLLPSYVVGDAPPPALSQAQLEARLTRWLTAERVLPRPKRAERSLVYLIVTPLGTQLHRGGASAPQCAFGYCAQARFESEPRARAAGAPDNNLLYAVVPLVSTSSEILDFHSLSISHHLAQALILRARGSASRMRTSSKKRAPGRRPATAMAGG